MFKTYKGIIMNLRNEKIDCMIVWLDEWFVG